MGGGARGSAPEYPHTPAQSKGRENPQGSIAAGTWQPMHTYSILSQVLRHTWGPRVLWSQLGTCPPGRASDPCLLTLMHALPAAPSLPIPLACVSQSCSDIPHYVMLPPGCSHNSILYPTHLPPPPPHPYPTTTSPPFLLPLCLLPLSHCVDTLIQPHPHYRGGMCPKSQGGSRGDRDDKWSSSQSQCCTSLATYPGPAH